MSYTHINNFIISILLPGLIYSLLNGRVELNFLIDKNNVSE
jgi:hypothetical protein